MERGKMILRLKANKRMRNQSERVRMNRERNGRKRKGKSRNRRGFLKCTGN